MTIMMNPDYERGVDAANRTLDRSTLNAQDLRMQWMGAMSRAQTAEDRKRYEYAKGFVDTIQEFLDDKAG